MREYAGAVPLRRVRDGGCGFLRLRASIAGHVQTATIAAHRPRHERLEFGPPHHPRADVVRSRHLEPRVKPPLIVFVLADVHYSAGAKTGVAAGQPVHVAPQTQTVENERHLAFVAPGLSAPPPIPARLLAGDIAFFAHHDVDTARGQRQRGGHANDAAADDDHARGGGYEFIRGHRIDVRTHGVLSWIANRASYRAAWNTPRQRRPASRRSIRNTP